MISTLGNMAYDMSSGRQTNLLDPLRWCHLLAIHSYSSAEVAPEVLECNKIKRAAGCKLAASLSIMPPWMAVDTFSFIEARSATARCVLVLKDIIQYFC
jgi:hypothetical protein